MTRKSVLVKWLLAGCLCICTASLLAQTNPVGRVAVKVTVVDAEKNPLPGATVKVGGKPIGISNDRGEVVLQVPQGAKVEFQYIGMKNVVMHATKPISGTVTLLEDYSKLDDVVVTGYQRTTKKRNTGSVGVLSAEELMKGAPTANMDMLLQGKIAGVDVKAVSGRPGESAKIRIRGTNTITGNADPLWVVDGIPLQRDIPAISSSQVRAGDFNNIFSNGIAGINPNDIESVTVLKDASAAAIYGSRAAGGVIVVTTKRGKEGKLQVNYSANVSVVTAPPRDASLMNSREKLAWEQELWDEFSAERFAQSSSGTRYPVIGVVGMIRSGYGKYAGMTSEQQDAAIAELGEHTTDWFKELFQNSISQSHYLSLSGGSDKSAYYVSMGYSKNNGLVKKTDYDRYNVSAKLDMKPHRRVKLGFSLDASMQQSDSPSLNVDPFKYAYFANPYERPYNDDGSYRADETYFAFTHANGAYDVRLPQEGVNILREMNETSSKAKNFTATAIANLSVSILDNLSFEGLASYGYVSDNNDNINGKDTYAAWQDRPFEKDQSLTSTRKYGSISQSSAYNTNYNLRGQLHYFDTFHEAHYVSALLGAEIRGSYAKSIFEKRYGYDPVTGNSSIPVYPNGSDLSYNDLLNYGTIIDGLSGQSITQTTFASFYFSGDYVLNNRYVASLTLRTDGSNNFGSDEQFNPTGSLGLAWNIDQEPFMDTLKPLLSSLSLRTAFGYTGNINKTVYPQLVMDYSNAFRKGENDYYRIGTLRNAPNPNLRWEKTRDMKVSLDMGFISDKLRFQFEAYDRRTTDAVLASLVPHTTGFSSQSYNVGSLLNQGVEFTLSAHPLQTKDWSLSLTGNIAYNRNKFLKADAGKDKYFLSGTDQVGYPLGAIMTGKVVGIDKRLGIYEYLLRPDAVVNTAADRSNGNNYLFYRGTSSAPLNGGYSISLSYKKLLLSVGGSYSLKGRVLNNITAPNNYASLSASVQEAPATQENDLYVNFYNVHKDAVHRWTPQNPITDGHPRIVDAYGDKLYLSDYMTTSSTITRASQLENVSYFKLGTLLLSYQFDGASWLKRTPLTSLSLSFSMSNLFTITNYSGIDPETPGAVYPSPRTFSMGLSVGF